MSTIVAFLLFIGVISAPEQATEALKDSYRTQCEQHVSIVGEDITGW
ncbi:MAG: hypothetical protein HUU01_14785 [Saprospiraceae bacterium]|nr:hypothetical protein [Saprospiraceae bacterium]